jgi:carboxylate-amine ligase
MRANHHSKPKPSDNCATALDLTRTPADQEQYSPRSQEDLFRFGVEEEFFLSDGVTFEPATYSPDALFENIASPANSRAGREMLQSQIEIATAPCAAADEARQQLAALRRATSAAAEAHGLVALACGTHPRGSWHNAVESPRLRYSELMDHLQMIGRRNMLCGMHVHVEIPPGIDRVQVMNGVVPYVPLFMALATSSPFWNGVRTGLFGYRLAAYDELPRTGLPELFESEEHYRQYVQALVRGGAVPDESYIWWAIRPSHKYPTLELRAADSCTRLDDAVAIAALYRELIRHLCGDGAAMCRLDVLDRSIAQENKWRAQRYGIHATFVTRTGSASVAQTLDRLLERVFTTADESSHSELMACRRILETGTSADAQISIFDRYRHYGVDFALGQVIRWVKDTTVQDQTCPSHGIEPVQISVPSVLAKNA